MTTAASGKSSGVPLRAISACSLDEGERRAEHARLARAREHGHEEHHRHEGEVLDEEDPGRRLPLGRVDLAVLLVELEDDRRAREGDEEPDEDGGRPGRTESREDDRRRPDGEADLERAARQHARQDLAEALERELDPDAEEEERDAELGELLDRIRAGHEAEAARARDHARHQVGGDGRQPEPAPGEQPRRRDGEEDDDLDGEHGGRGASAYPIRRSMVSIRRSSRENRFRSAVRPAMMALLRRSMRPLSRSKFLFSYRSVPRPPGRAE